MNAQDDQAALEDYRKRIRATLREGEASVEKIPGASSARKLLARQALRREARVFVGRDGIK